MSPKRARPPSPSLVERLRGPHDSGWQAKQYEKPPEIQLEAATELLKIGYQLTLHRQFLERKGLLAEFAGWADGAQMRRSLADHN